MLNARIIFFSQFIYAFLGLVTEFLGLNIFWLWYDIEGPTVGDLLIFADKVRTVCLTFFQKYYYIVIKNSCLYCHIYELARQKHI